MKKVVSVILCIFVFTVPLLCFADSIDIPVMTLVGNRDAKSVDWFGTSLVSSERWLWSDDPEVFGGIIKIGDNYSYLFISPNSGSIGYHTDPGNSNYPHDLSDYSDGYYYSNTIASLYSTNNYINEYPSGTSISDIVSAFADAHSVVFNLSDITDGAILWLSAVVDGVLQAPMLLFLILVPFIGIAVGLLFRFRRG